MKAITRILTTVAIALTIQACVQVRTKLPEPSSAQDIEDLLSSDQEVPRTDPFRIRQFNPKLDGKWIGKAVSYGFYRKGQAPGVQGPSKEEILQDLKIIGNHWNLIRVYNADEDTRKILEVIRDNNLPIKVMLGIWLDNEEERPQIKASNIANLLKGIELTNAFPNQIMAVNVGNETQVFWSGHRLDTQTLIRYIRILRSSTSVPVTTADDYNYWNKPPSVSLANELDFITLHAYPLWNGLTLETAFSWLDNTLAEVQAIHPHNTLILGEIGWATNYDSLKKGEGQQGTLIKGEVGLAAQERFLTLLDSWINSRKVCTFLFEAFDEPWKGGGESSPPNEIEKNWGVYYENRLPKQSFTNYLARQSNDK